jgi:nucleoside-diphosphate-sugar epimerase
MTKVLVTGAFGQIGSALRDALQARYGDHNVIATGKEIAGQSRGGGEVLDVTDGEAVFDSVRRHDVDVIYHLAAILSARGEDDPALAWHVNMNGLRNVLEAARLAEVKRVFWPSSIAAFGPDTPRDQVPQDIGMRPTTMYGVSKVAGELLCDYYFHRYRLDVRGVRYPGVISSEQLPGGGTTDYAVEIFYAAVTTGHYTCFVREDCVLPMIYMPDCVRAAIEVMEADLSHLIHHNAFNLGAMTFSAGELAQEIKKHRPDFTCDFVPDQRQAIADTWPHSLDDSAARREWGWKPSYDLARMTTEMLDKLEAKRRAGEI